MQDQPNDLHSRVRRLDESVERLRTEVTSLRHELAALAGVLQDSQQPSTRPGSPRHVVRTNPTRKPSLIPAAIVVLISVSLLSWQLISTPRVGRGDTVARAATSPPSPQSPPAAPTIDEAKQATEPPLTPLVQPTIYKGTLAITADRPDSEVFVNRQPVGKAPVRLRNLRAGAHLVWVEHDGFRRWTRVVTVPAERVTRVSADLEPVGNR